MDGFWTAITGFGFYFGMGACLCVAFVWIYTRITPLDEITLIVDGHNAAAALSTGMSLIGFVIPLARAMAQAVSPLEFLAWGLVAMVVQVLCYGLARLTHRNLAQGLAGNCLSAGLWVGFIGLAGGLLSAAAMTG